MKNDRPVVDQQGGFECAHSNLDHFFHTVPAQNIDFFGGPHALTTLGANQLACAAGTFAAWGRSRSRLGRTSRSGTDDGRQAGPSDLNFVPAL